MFLNIYRATKKTFKITLRNLNSYCFQVNLLLVERETVNCIFVQISFCKNTLNRSCTKHIKPIDNLKILHYRVEQRFQ